MSDRSHLTLECEHLLYGCPETMQHAELVKEHAACDK